jgi:hypothetical protein
MLAASVPVMRDAVRNVNEQLQRELEPEVEDSPIRLRAMRLDGYARARARALPQSPPLDTFPVAMIEALIRDSLHAYVDARVESGRTYARRAETEARALQHWQSEKHRFDAVVGKSKTAASAALAMGRTLLQYRDEDAPVRRDFFGYRAVHQTNEEGLAAVHKAASAAVAGAGTAKPQVPGAATASPAAGAAAATTTTADVEGTTVEMADDGSGGTRATVTLKADTEMDNLTRKMRRVELNRLHVEEAKRSRDTNAAYPGSAMSVTPGFWLARMDFTEKKTRRDTTPTSVILPLPVYDGFLKEHQASPSPIQITKTDSALRVPARIRWVDEPPELDRAVHPELDDMNALYEEHVARHGGTRGRSISDCLTHLIIVWTTAIPMLLWSVHLTPITSRTARRVHLIELGRRMYELAQYHARCMPPGSPASKQCATPNQLARLLLGATFRAWHAAATPALRGAGGKLIYTEAEPWLRCGSGSKEDGNVRAPESAQFRVGLMREMRVWCNAFGPMFTNTMTVGNQSDERVQCYRLVRALANAFVPVYLRAFVMVTDRPLLSYSEYDMAMNHPMTTLGGLHPHADDIMNEWLIGGGVTVAHHDHMRFEKVEKDNMGREVQKTGYHPRTRRQMRAWAVARLAYVKWAMGWEVMEAITSEETFQYDAYLRELVLSESPSSAPSWLTLPERNEWRRRRAQSLGQVLTLVFEYLVGSLAPETTGKEWPSFDDLCEEGARTGRPPDPYSFFGECMDPHDLVDKETREQIMSNAVKYNKRTQEVTGRYNTVHGVDFSTKMGKDGQMEVSIGGDGKKNPFVTIAQRAVARTLPPALAPAGAARAGVATPAATAAAAAAGSGLGVTVAPPSSADATPAAAPTAAAVPAEPKPRKGVRRRS